MLGMPDEPDPKHSTVTFVPNLISGLTVLFSDAQAMKAVANSFDLIISTVSVDLDWGIYLNALRPKGRLHFVGFTPNPIQASTVPLIVGQKSVSGSPLGSPSTTVKMLDFCARHHIEPLVEIFPFGQINEAIARLESGKARYRIVLKH
jgi:alcohol/geraniol dehydrogenase (NADP+)